MNEKELEKLLETPEVQDIELDKKIRRSVNKKIYTRSLIIVIVLSILGGLGYKAYQKHEKIVYYDPRVENDFILEEPPKDDGVNVTRWEDGLDEVRGFTVLFSTYFNMLYPNLAMDFDSFEDLGSGNYVFKGNVHDLFDNISIGGKTNFELHINQSKFTIEYKDDVKVNFWLHEYVDVSDKHIGLNLKEMKENYGDLTKDIEDVKLLPDSSILDVAVSFSRPFTIEETAALMHKYLGNPVSWLPYALKDSGCYGCFAGASLGNFWTIDLLDRSKYPDFYKVFDDGRENAENIEKQYLAQLQILLDHSEFVNLASECFRGRLPLEEIQERYDFIKEGGLNPIGMRIKITKQDFLDLIENEDVIYFRVKNVKLSRFSN